MKEMYWCGFPELSLKPRTLYKMRLLAKQSSTRYRRYTKMQSWLVWQYPLKTKVEFNLIFQTKHNRTLMGYFSRLYLINLMINVNTTRIPNNPRRSNTP